MIHEIKLSKSIAKATKYGIIGDENRIQLRRAKWNDHLKSKVGQKMVNNMFEKAIEHIKSGASKEETHTLHYEFDQLIVFLSYTWTQKDDKWHFEIIVPKKYLFQAEYIDITRD